MVQKTTELPIRGTSELPDTSASEAEAIQRKVDADMEEATREAREQREHEDAEALQRKVNEDMQQAEREAASARARASRKTEFDAQRATEKAKREIASDQAKNKKFDESQEQWNSQKRREYSDEKKGILNGSDFEKKQEEIVKSRQMDPFTPKTAVGKAASKVKNIYKRATEKEPACGDDRLDAIRRRNRDYDEDPRRRPLREKKAKPATRGQFKNPSAGGGSYIDPFPKGGGRGGGFPAIDPMGGFGGRGRNMMSMDMSLPGSGRGQAPARQPRPMRRAPPPPPRPRAMPRMFRDPFAGIAKATGKAPNIVTKGIGHGVGLGLGSGKKTAKKLGKLDDWLKF